MDPRDGDPESASRSGDRLLSTLSERERDALLGTARRRRFRSGEVVFHFGDPVGDVHLILAGRFALYVMQPTGEEAMLRILGPGDMFGEMALFESDSSRSATVRAMQPGETASIDRRSFNALRQGKPDLTDALLAILADKVRRGDAQLLEALFVPAEVRVLRRLVELVEVYAVGESSGSAAESGVVIPLRQEDLATLAGTSRATVNRVLRVEQGRGAVDLHRGRITVLDVDGVRKRSR